VERDDLLEKLGQYLVWRIGKPEDEEVLVVRVGPPSALPRFAMRRLLNVSDREAEALWKAGKVRVEWVE
jgi:hypothetical protein